MSAFVHWMVHHLFLQPRGTQNYINHSDHMTLANSLSPDANAGRQDVLIKQLFDKFCKETSHIMTYVLNIG